MINGPDHFITADRILDAETEVNWREGTPAEIANDLALAQCRATEAVGHALLAVAAAVGGLYAANSDSNAAREWRKILLRPAVDVAGDDD